MLQITMAAVSPQGGWTHMGLETRQSGRDASHSALAASHSGFLIYGTGIRNALNPRICTTNLVLIYGNPLSRRSPRPKDCPRPRCRLRWANSLPRAAWPKPKHDRNLGGACEV